jgi:hypothetical protein
MPPAEFEIAIPASERSQTYNLDCAATGVSWHLRLLDWMQSKLFLSLVASVMRSGPVQETGLKYANTDALWLHVSTV